MCGILGCFTDKEIIYKDFYKSLSLLEHRGPDDWGICEISKDAFFENSQSDGNAFFGHRRLSILDLSKKGHQPMIFDNLCLIFNGEILNYKELRKELIENDYTFNSNSDTEVLLKGWHFWGKQVLNKLEGMWAFGIFDLKNYRLVLCRDRFGIKPLYYQRSKDNFIFSSEIKPILNLSQKTPEPNLEVLNEFLFWGNTDWKSDCFFEGIERLLPSSFIEIQFTKEMKIKNFQTEKYYDIVEIIKNKRSNILNLSSAKEEYYSLLVNSVNLSLEADVPVGSALSGGLDSSSVVSIINELKKKKTKKSIQSFQKTFSSVYNDTPECDESVFIQQLSDYLQVENLKTYPSLEKFNNEIEKFIYYQEEPVGGASVFAGWCVAELTSKHVTVTLDGQGADEYLYGYNYFYGALLKSNMRNPLKIFRLLFNRNNTFDLKKAIKYFLGFLFNKKTEQVFLSKIKKSLGFSEKIPSQELSFFNLKNIDDAISYAFNGLVNLLKYLDRNTMAFSVESRPPFLNRKLIEFSLNLPMEYIIKNGWNKYIARIAMENSLPKNIVWRKDKMGFPAPESKWVISNIDSILERTSKSRILNELPLNLKDSDNLRNDTNILFKLDQIAFWEKVFSL